MKQIIQTLKTPKFYIGLVVFLLSIFAMYLSNQFLDKNYPDPVKPDDLVLDRFEQIDAFIVIGEILVLVQLVMLVASAFRHDLKPAGKYLFAVGLLYLIRAGAILLTPLEELHQTNGNHIPVISDLFYGGMFFSGHIGFAFLVYFLEEKRGKFKISMLVLALAIVICLILGNSHYSIDILGGYLVAFFIAKTKFWEYLKL